MRRAIALIMVLSVFCCSVFAGPSASADTVIDALSDGLGAAMVSWLSEPRIALQGVTVVSGEGVLPSLISFVRSDVSTYLDSLSFFYNGQGITAGNPGILSELLRTFSSDAVRGYLGTHSFKPGDAVLDGSVRLLSETGSDSVLGNNEDWTDYNAYCSFSIMVTGAVTDGGFIAEGMIRIEGGPERGVTIVAEDFKVNDEIVEIRPFSFSFGT